MKRTTSLYLDGEILELALKQGMNISQEVNTFLKSRVLGLEAIESVNLDNIERKRIEFTNKIVSLNRELSLLDEKKALLIKKDDEEVEKRMESYFQ